MNPADFFKSQVEARRKGIAANMSGQGSRGARENFASFCRFVSSDKRMSSPQERFRGASSGVSRKASEQSLRPDDKDWEAHKAEQDTQREQDLDAARLMSHARETSQPWTEDETGKLRTPMASMPMRATGISAAMKQFYLQNGGSSTSLDSQNFIDHRNQSHSFSVNPKSPLAVLAQKNVTGVQGLHTEPARGEMQDDASEPRPAPPVNYSSLASSPVEPANDMESPAQSQIIDPAGNAHLEDVCFPVTQHVNEPVAQDTPAPTAETNRPGYPYTFDLTALDKFVEEEREQTSPVAATRGVSIGGAATTFGPYAGHTTESGLYSRRPQRVKGAAGEGGSKYQRKLALFEGGNAYPATDSRKNVMATSPEAMKAESELPLLQGVPQPTYHGFRDEPEAPPAPMRSQSQPYPGMGKAPLTHAMQDKPYRFTFYSNSLPQTIHARFLHEIPGPDQSFEDLIRGSPEPEAKNLSTSVPAGGHLPSHVKDVVSNEPNTWWLDVLCPTDQEMKALSRAFGIHPLTTEDILMEETREKIELFRNYYLVCFRSFDQDPYSVTYLEPLNMYIIVFREGTLSFHFRQTPHPTNVRRRIKQLKDYINVTSDWISYALIDDITDAFAPLIQSIEFEVDSIDELVLILKEAEQSDMLRRIGTCRKKVMGLLRLMGNKADVVKGLAKRSNEYWAVAPKSEIGLYLSDIQDHLITMTQNLNHYEMILSRSHSNYLAQISIEMTDANNQINDVLSKLTALGTIIVPLNVITGLWGMNVQVPGQKVDNLNWFGGICAVMIVIAVSGYIITLRYLNGR